MKAAATFAALAALTAGLLLPSAARAQSYGLYANVNTIANQTFPGPAQSVQNANNLSFTDQPQAAALNALNEVASVSNGGTAEAKFLGSIGLLKTYASAGFPYCCTVGGVTVTTGYTYATAQGSFLDSVTVSGAGLAVGTPVSYRVDFSINGTLSSPTFELGGHLGVDGLAQVRLRDINNNGEEVVLNWDAKLQAGGVYSLTLPTVVGHTLQISGMLYALATVDSSALLARFAESDFYHSAGYTLVPSVAGLNTIGASGHNFLAPVPEPSTVWLMASGVLLLAFRRGVRPPHSSPTDAGGSVAHT